MKIYKEDLDLPMLRIRTVEGRFQVFVNIEGKDHVIGGVTSASIDDIYPDNILGAQLDVYLGGLGDT